MNPPPDRSLRVSPAVLAQRLEGLRLSNPVRPIDRVAAVLLLVLDRPHPSFLGIVRKESGLHGGQFALPGGGVEPGDRDAWAAAVREAREEVGLRDEPIALGRLGDYDTVVSRTRVTVQVGFLPRAQSWSPQESEVQGIFEVPWAPLVALYEDLPPVERGTLLPIDAGFEFDAAPYCVAGVLPPRGRGHRLTTPSGTHDMPFVWGLTARILYDFIHHVWQPDPSAKP
ncbi:MAG: CoA pyrophosphatase [Planctomycetota bacterium]